MSLAELLYVLLPVEDSEDSSSTPGGPHSARLVEDSRQSSGLQSTFQNTWLKEPSERTAATQVMIEFNESHSLNEGSRVPTLIPIVLSYDNISRQAMLLR